MISLPQSFKLISEANNTSVFECEGLYPGYGITLGNALRRVLLSSIPGAAIVSVKIKGANHEFSSIPGILEDMLEICLNLKGVRLILHGDEPQMVTLKLKGRKEVTAGDIVTPSQVEVVSRETHIATITDRDTTFEMEMEVARGAGYEQADQRKAQKAAIGTLNLDALYSPVRKANFSIEDMRVGDRTDYNRLKLEIETDGTITAHKALQGALQILIDQYAYLMRELGEEAEEKGERKQKSKSEGAEGAEDIMKKKVDDLVVSARPMRALQDGGIKTVAGLIRKSEKDILEMDGMGEAGLKEVKKALKKLGLTLKEG